MIAIIFPKKLLPILIMLFVMVGMSLSVIGEASSHGVAELAETSAHDHDDHPHSHDDEDTGAKSDGHLHHDTGNHSHETVDHLTVRLFADYSMSFRPLISFAGESPRSFRYRLERPPKAILTI